MAYTQICHEHKFNQERLIWAKPLFETFSYNKLKDCYEQMKPNTFFVCEGGGLPLNCTYWLNVVRTQKKLYVFQSEHIVEFDECDATITISEPTEEDWKKIVLDIGIDNFSISHYDYLELMLDDFWKLVFGKTASEMWCSGIIGAHGDKAYGYNQKWSDAGIPFGRGVLLFLLTYTKERGETPKHESCQWVIDNYQKYLPHIEAAEKNAGLIT